MRKLCPLGGRNLHGSPLTSFCPGPQGWTLCQFWTAAFPSPRGHVALRCRWGRGVGRQNVPRIAGCPSRGERSPHGEPLMRPWAMTGSL
jgi:hypothetical protein